MKENTMDRVELNWNELPFDYIRTDAHLEYRFENGSWGEGRVVEEDTLTLPMAATALHYGQECFEGLKVFEGKDGRVLSFRPDENAKRIRQSAGIIHMVPPTEDTFLEAVDRVVQLNRRWIPPYGTGAALYIRPLLLGVTGTVGIKASREYLFVVFATPVGPYFKTGLKPVRLRVEEEMDRAAMGGVGHAKVGGNYAAGLRGLKRSQELGFAESLYLDAREHKYIDETGASNFFGITKDGVYVTPKSPSILPSITNKSLMALARDMDLTVEQRAIPVEELGDFVEAGCVGTAAIITPVHEIAYRDRVFRYGSADAAGPVSQKLYDRLVAIQHGDAEDTHGWIRHIPME